MNKHKQLFIGILVGAILFGAMPVFAETADILIKAVSIIANGKKTDLNSIVHKGTTFVPIDTIAEALDMTVNRDESANTISLMAKDLKATLSNYSPIKNEVITLNVTGEKFKGLPYKAEVKYKTTSTPFEGKVGEPSEIKIGTATPDYRVVIYILVNDSKNNREYELVTSFTPPKQK